MGDFFILGLVSAVIGFTVYYLVKQKKNSCHSDLCAGCTQHEQSCSKCDVDTLKRELKEQLHKSS